MRIPRDTSPLLSPSVLSVYWLSFVAGCLLAANVAALPHLANSFSLTGAGVARLLGAIALGGVFALVGARLSDRFGRRKLLLGSVACAYPLIAATVFAPSVWVYAGLQIVLAGLMGTLHAATLVAVEEHLPPALKARGQSWAGVMFVMGNGAGLIVVAAAAFLFPIDAWRYAWAFFTVAALVHPLLYFYLKETPEFVTGRDLREGDIVRWSALFSPGYRQVTLSLFAALLCWYMAQAAVAGWLVYHPVENLGVNQQLLTVMLIVGGWPALLGFALGVRLRDRMGGYRQALIASCLVSVLGNVVFYSLRPDVPLLMLWLGGAYIVGLLLSNAFLVNFRLFINEHYPTHLRASMQSVAIFAHAASAVLAQVVVAVLIAPAGGEANAILALIAIKLLVVMFLLVTPVPVSKARNTFSAQTMESAVKL